MYIVMQIYYRVRSRRAAPAPRIWAVKISLGASVLILEILLSSFSRVADS